MCLNSIFSEIENSKKLQEEQIFSEKNINRICKAIEWH